MYVYMYLTASQPIPKFELKTLLMKGRRHPFEESLTAQAKIYIVNFSSILLQRDLRSFTNVTHHIFQGLWDTDIEVM